jgi:hypothetical protein
MHIHTVFFWLNANVSDIERSAFENELVKLTLDPEILQRRVGKPANTNRDVIDSSYDFGISLCFENLDSHDRYQAGDAHQDFLNNCQGLWAQVRVYDMNDIIMTEVVHQGE